MKITNRKAGVGVVETASVDVVGERYRPSSSTPWRVAKRRPRKWWARFVDAVSGRDGREQAPQIETRAAR